MTAYELYCCITISYCTRVLENVGVRLTVRVNENVGVTDLVNETVMVSVRVWLWKQHTHAHMHTTHSTYK